MEWNAIVSIYRSGHKRALEALAKLGRVEPSSYHHVLVVSVDDPLGLIATVEQQAKQDPALYGAIARVAPAMRNFEFRSTNAFYERIKPIVCEWTLALAGRSFHVRMHRRGGPVDLHATEVEQRLDGIIREATGVAGKSATVCFDRPDAVIVIDTVGARAGVSLWTRYDVAQHRLLRPD